MVSPIPSKGKQGCGGLLWRGSNVSKCGGGHSKKRSIGHSLEDALDVTIDAIGLSTKLTIESRLVQETKTFIGAHRRCSIDQR